jgi:hypothetical protein
MKYPSMEESFYSPAQQYQANGLYSQMPQYAVPGQYQQPMAGYPMQSMYPGQEYVNSSAYYPAMPYTASPYYTPPIPQPEPASLSSSRQSITEEEIKERINAKIDSIIEAQKTEMLSNQIEKLTDRVQKLSRNFAPPGPSYSSPSQASMGPESISSSYAGQVCGNDEDISTRLRQLASESMKKTQPRSAGRRLPDW